jgi:Flp pilus assembly protein TadD
VPALVNLADLDRARGTDAEGEKLLREAMTIEPDNADVNYALGLSLVRRREYAGALDLLRRAQDLAPDNARYAYFFAVALNSNGAHGEATAVLERTHRQHPADREVPTAFVSIAQDTRDPCSGAVARASARRARSWRHTDPQALLELEKRQAH